MGKGDRFIRRHACRFIIIKVFGSWLLFRLQARCRCMYIAKTVRGGGTFGCSFWLYVCLSVCISLTFLQPVNTNKKEDRKRKPKSAHSSRFAYEGCRNLWESIHAAVKTFMMANTLLVDLVPLLDEYSAGLNERIELRDIVEPMRRSAERCHSVPLIAAHVR